MFEQTGNSFGCIIIGAGASGLMLAANLDVSECGGGIILEKTNKAGTKLLMSGGGRCNITHGGSIKDFISAYGEAGSKIRKILYRHNNYEVASWLESAGIALADEYGNRILASMIENEERIFPESMKSSDILNLFLSKAKENGWEIRTESEVYDISAADDGSWMIKASPAETYTAKNVVIASGGITYPETGSDGSMFDIIRGLGINVTPLRSARAKMDAEDYPYEELSGITLSDVSVSVHRPGSGALKSKFARMTGDMLFTHSGFSGPVVLNISRYAEPGDILRLSYNSTAEDLPKRMQRVLESRAKGPSGDIRTTVLSHLLAADDFIVRSVDEHGMVTSGGIDLGCIDMNSMELRSGGTKLTGLYAIGEAIDADGITGGYNLQLCWSSARTAAESIRQKLTGADQSSQCQ